MPLPAFLAAAARHLIMNTIGDAITSGGSVTEKAVVKSAPKMEAIIANYSSVRQKLNAQSIVVSIS